METANLGSSLASSPQGKPKAFAEAGCGSDSSLVETIPLEKFAWSLEGASWITEAQSYYMIGDDGSLLFLQLAYSNIGWPYTSFQASALYFNAGGGIHQFSTSNTSTRSMSTNTEKTSMQIKRNQFQQIPPLLAAGDENSAADAKGTMLLRYDGEIKIALEFTVVGEGIKVKNGNWMYGVDGQDGYVGLKYLPMGRCIGSVQLENNYSTAFHGLGLCIHEFQGIKPYHSASKWNLAIFIAKDREASLLLIQAKTPAAYDSIIFNQGLLFKNGHTEAMTINNTVVSKDEQADPHTGYPLPKSINYNWDGKTIDNQPFSATCSAKPETLVGKVDVLENFPYLLRKVVETFMTRPHVYQWLDEAQVELKIGDESEVLDGRLFHEISFINKE